VRVVERREEELPFRPTMEVMLKSVNYYLPITLKIMIETGEDMTRNLSHLINRDFRNNDTLKCKIQSEMTEEFGKFFKISRNALWF
jgi:hypothetical protein